MYVFDLAFWSILIQNFTRHQILELAKQKKPSQLLPLFKAQQAKPSQWPFDILMEYVISATGPCARLWNVPGYFSPSCQWLLVCSILRDRQESSPRRRFRTSCVTSPRPRYNVKNRAFLHGQGVRELSRGGCQNISKSVESVKTDWFFNIPRIRL